MAEDNMGTAPGSDAAEGASPAAEAARQAREEERIRDSLDDLLADGPEGEGDEAAEEAQIGQSGEIDALREENAELKDRYVRALAETENVRKRAQRDRQEAEQYGGSKLARDLLPVYDNLVRALDAAGESEAKGLVEGVELTLRELISVFGKHGIDPIVPEEGDKFDPAIHQAMFEAPVPGTKAGDIIQVAATGFMLRERLLRPAQVGVSSTPAS